MPLASSVDTVPLAVVLPVLVPVGDDSIGAVRSVAPLGIIQYLRRFFNIWYGFSERDCSIPASSRAALAAQIPILDIDAEAESSFRPIRTNLLVADLKAENEEPSHGVVA